MSAIRDPIKWGLLSSVGIIVIVTSAFANDLTGSRPNIVLVMTDDQGYGPIGRHGHPWLQTPHLDALYDTSTRFTRFQVSPTCSPTRAALMTGRHPMRNGITHTILERERLTLKATTLAETLQAAGYATGIFGKWHLGDEEPYQPHNRGFDETFVHGAGGIGQAFRCSCADAPNNKYFDPIVRHNGSFVKTSGFCTDVFFTSALGWIKEMKDREAPFFAYITTNAPHAPFIAPEHNAARFLELGFQPKYAGFYGMVENIDENVGRLLGKLTDWQLLDRTLIIFLSDNGMTAAGGGQGQLGTGSNDRVLSAYNAGMKGLKGDVDEGGTRVPAFFRWDGRLQANREIDRIAAHIDIFPTLTEFAGASNPDDQVEGRSLIPLLENPQSDWSDRYLFTHRGRWKTGAEPNNHQWNDFAVRNQRFRFVNNHELFDIERDPGQTTNVLDRHPNVVEAMREAYDAWWQETRPLMVNETAPMSPVKPFHQLYNRQAESIGIPTWTPPEL